VITESDQRELAHRIVHALDQRDGPFTPARRARLMLAVREVIEQCPPRQQAEWLKAFGVRR
jgi:hypothetical protein